MKHAVGYCFFLRFRCHKWRVEFDVDDAMMHVYHQRCIVNENERRRKQNQELILEFKPSLEPPDSYRTLTSLR